MAATQIELLAAVLAGSKRRDIHALLTTIYPLVSGEENPIAGSVGISDIREITQHFEVPVVGGSVSVSEIEKQTVLITYTEEENEITGTVSVSEIDKTVVLITYDEIENEITGTVSVSEIEKTVVLIEADNTESEITGTVSVSEIIKV